MWRTFANFADSPSARSLKYIEESHDMSMFLQRNRMLFIPILNLESHQAATAEAAWSRLADYSFAALGARYSDNPTEEAHIGLTMYFEYGQS